jgi:hypothetical protein
MNIPSRIDDSPLPPRQHVSLQAAGTQVADADERRESPGFDHHGEMKVAPLIPMDVE